MRYGLEISAAGACGDARTLADLAQLAEEAGWDGIFLEDYIIHYDAQYVRTYDPWVALAAMALAHAKRRSRLMRSSLCCSTPEGNEFCIYGGM